MNNFNINDLLSLAKGDPQAMYDNMLKTNPQFARFVEETKGKTPEEIAKANNIDPALLSLFNMK